MKKLTEAQKRVLRAFGSEYVNKPYRMREKELFKYAIGGNLIASMRTLIRDGYITTQGDRHSHDLFLTNAGKVELAKLLLPEAEADVAYLKGCILMEGGS